MKNGNFRLEISFSHLQLSRKKKKKKKSFQISEQLPGAIQQAVST